MASYCLRGCLACARRLRRCFHTWITGGCDRRGSSAIAASSASWFRCADAKMCSRGTVGLSSQRQIETVVNIVPRVTRNRSGFGVFLPGRRQCFDPRQQSYARWLDQCASVTGVGLRASTIAPNIAATPEPVKTPSLATEAYPLVWNAWSAR
jgi:hypothetical protein